MIPLSDGIPARRFPVVNVALIVANFAVFLFYELPDRDAAISQASFYPCDITNACHLGIPWGVSWITSMFMHGNWHHILGNMVFLAVFGKNVEAAFGRLGYLALYLGGGFAATVSQTAMILHFAPTSCFIPVRASSPFGRLRPPSQRGSTSGSGFCSSCSKATSRWSTPTRPVAVMLHSSPMSVVLFSVCSWR
jgi:hypothetical protein